VTKFHYGVTNWLPFYWKGFHQRTHYSYVLEPLDDPARLFDNFKGSVRTDIRKAESRHRVELSDDWPLLYELNLQVFDRRSVTPPFSRDWLGNLDETLRDRGQRRLYLARTKKEGAPVAAAYTVHDAQSAYLLLTGRSSETESGAVALLIWRAIQDYCAAGIPRFDFEGSMLPGVEHFFRGFGGELKPYFRVVNRGYRRMEVLREGF
jgi:lipid II:glycine glycyltransferase (peptidoglycan interpeptide bridge formation enzyme)